MLHLNFTNLHRPSRGFLNNLTDTIYCQKFQEIMKLDINCAAKSNKSWGTEWITTETMLKRYKGWETIKPVFFLATRGCMTTCMVVTPLGRSPTVILESASVLLFSKILPACMSFTSFIDLGVIVLPVYAKKTLH